MQHCIASKVIVSLRSASIRISLFVLLLLSLSACVTSPTGKAKVDLIDQLVSEQEFNKIQKLLNNIDTKDPEFEALVVRRRAIRPLIVQYERYTVEHIRNLQAKDLWPQALEELQRARDKLPDSEILKQAEDEFFIARAARIAAVQQRIGLLEGQSHANKLPLVDKILEIHPTGIRSRWQHFQSQRKSRALAQDLLACGNQAWQQQALDLAEACFTMVRALSVDVDVSQQLAAIESERQRIAENAIQIAEKKALEQQQQQAEKIFELKEQYRHLAAAGWLSAAKHTIVDLRLLAPEDKEVREWAITLKAAIDKEVEQGIRQGQALYSHGQLEEALIVWQNAAQLDPDNPILQGHIARAERFIEKLQRLDKRQI